jgi:hypothetical protein
MLKDDDLQRSIRAGVAAQPVGRPGDQRLSEEDQGAGKASEKGFSIIGVAVLCTVVWCGAAMSFALLSPLPTPCGGPLRCMALNEWGDFIAGVSAPLAFLWLVVAVFIQSKELSEQRAELRLTRREFEQNRKVMEEQAEEARKQAEFIGVQTALLQKQVAADDRTRQEAQLESVLSELSLMIQQHLYNQSVLHGIRADGKQGGAQMIERGHDRDGWIIALATFLHNLDNKGLRRPYEIAGRHAYAVSRVYDLCRTLEMAALPLGTEAVHKLDRLRISEIRSFIEANMRAGA